MEHQIINAIVNFINNNATSIEVVFGAIGFSAISSIPETRPKSLDEWWSWMRVTFQGAVPANRMVHPIQQTVVLPPRADGIEPPVNGSLSDIIAHYNRK